MQAKRQLWFIVVIIFGLIELTPLIQAQPTPSFIIFTPGFWGSMDKLPSKDPKWLAQSPYPHYRKHQEVSFLEGPNYIPIPQSLQAFGEGPSITKLLICSYNLMQKEFAFWAARQNKLAGYAKVKIFNDWQVLDDSANTTKDTPSIGEINIIYLKFDWRLTLPLEEKYYTEPLLSMIDRRWPEAKIHWLGHSLGGLLGRYAVACHPGRFTSLLTIGAPHYGIYEIGAQRRGERLSFGERWDIEEAQAAGLWLAEKFFFGSGVVQPGSSYYETAAEFGQKYTPVSQWLDPKEDLLGDGFNGLAKLKDAVPQAIAIYGLGYGSFDLKGNYHPELLEGKGVGPIIEPGGGPSDYAVTGDGRIDPVSARGPFTNTLCLGKDLQHGTLMWSPLVLTMVLDRYFFDSTMPRKDMLLSLRRTGVSWDDKERFYAWLLKARSAWGI